MSAKEEAEGVFHSGDEDKEATRAIAGQARRVIDKKQSSDRAKKLYDAFISYSHKADKRLAVCLQKALQGLAKPWYRIRGMRVFRDESDLSASPEGWPQI
jgi:hypothetical protein